MTQFGRTKVLLTGFSGEPGINIYNWCASAHADIAQGDVEDFHEILSTALYAFPPGSLATGVHWEIDPTCTIHEVDDGQLVGAFVDPHAVYGGTGSGDGDENRATQMGIRWRTADFRNGRQVQGRTFYGPLGGGNLDTAGRISSAVAAAVPGYFSGVIDSDGPRLIVWSRPSSTHPVGQYADVESVGVSTTPFVLRGRR